MMGVILETQALDVFGHMALDEAVLTLSKGEALVLRFYEWPGGPRARESPHAVTFGYFQTHEEVSRAMRDRGLPSPCPKARRPTGGGIVYHDSDLTFSLVFPWSRLAAPSLVYKDMHRGVHLGLKSLNIPSRLWSPGSAAGAAAAACFAGPSPMDLVHEDGTKFLGGALRRRHGLGLYQGSLRTEGFAAPRERLRRAVLDGLGMEWKAVFMPTEVDEETLLESERLRGERYGSDDWNLRR
jgi:lipoate-protein ligase A